jgi:hypothetical protein
LADRGQETEQNTPVIHFIFISNTTVVALQA